MNYLQNFDEQNFDKLLVSYKVEALRVCRKMFDESVAIHHICQNFPVKLLCHTVANFLC